MRKRAESDAAPDGPEGTAGFTVPAGGSVLGTAVPAAAESAAAVVSDSSGVL